MDSFFNLLPATAQLCHLRQTARNGTGFSLCRFPRWQENRSPLSHRATARQIGSAFPLPFCSLATLATLFANAKKIYLDLTQAHTEEWIHQNGAFLSCHDSYEKGMTRERRVNTTRSHESCWKTERERCVKHRPYTQFSKPPPAGRRVRNLTNVVLRVPFRIVESERECLVYTLCVPLLLSGVCHNWEFFSQHMVCRPRDTSK